jgi:carbohydrate-selective porin OprB
MLGDWGGLRTRLEQMGVTFYGEYRDQLWYQQGFLDTRLKIKIGQIAAVNEFGATDFFDILFNDELGYSPNTNFVTHQPFSPAGKPGIVATLDLRDFTAGLYNSI